MTWIFDIAELTESLSELDRTIRQVRLAKLRSWSHKPSFNLRIANLHAGKMCDGHNPHQMAAGDTNVGSRPRRISEGFRPLGWLRIKKHVAVAGADYTGFADTTAEKVAALLGDALDAVHP